MDDLYTDLRDGKLLIKLLEILSGERLVSLSILHHHQQKVLVFYEKVNISHASCVTHFLQPKPEKGEMRIHQLGNVNKALFFLYEQQVHLENLAAHDIVDGHPRLTLGLIWTIILRFQMQEITIIEGHEDIDMETSSAKQKLLVCRLKKLNLICVHGKLLFADGKYSHVYCKNNMANVHIGIYSTHIITK